MVEATEQLSRALEQIAMLPSTPALRREQIRLQVSLITPLMLVKGYAAPETRATVEKARLLIEQAEALGEPPSDPLLLFSVLYGLWVANYVGFNGEVLKNLAAQTLTFAEKQSSTIPLMVGHRLVGSSLACTGDIAQARAHFDQAAALYDPTAHGALATRFGQDVLVATLSFRAITLWMLGYPMAALAHTLQHARQIGHAGTLMYGLAGPNCIYLWQREFAVAKVLLDELFALATTKDAAFWRAHATMQRGCFLAEAGKASEAIDAITSTLTPLRSTGATMFMALWLTYLAKAYADIGQFDHAWCSIGEAMTFVKTAKEKWYEADIHRVAGEIALRSPERDTAKAEAYFNRSLTVARTQQAKSWELRAAMSMAGLWRDQGKRDEARELLAPVYGRFTEGFDTRDLKDAKNLLDELSAARRS